MSARPYARIPRPDRHIPTIRDGVLRPPGGQACLPAWIRRLAALLAGIVLTVAGRLAAGDPLPQPLVDEAVGSAGGGATYVSSVGGVGAGFCRFELVGAGAVDAGSGRFLRQDLPGDADLTVNVLDATGAAGLAMRSGGTSIWLVLEPGRLVRAIRHADPDPPVIVSGRSPADHAWLGLVRRGGSVEARLRDAGGGWTTLATFALPPGSATGGMWVSAGSASFASWDCRLVDPPAELGGNWGRVNDCYADLMRERSRPWYRVAADEAASCRADGWPAEDFAVYVLESLGLPDRSVHNGTYTIVWEDADAAQVAVQLRPAQEFAFGTKWHPRPGVSVQTLTLNFPPGATTAWNSNFTRLVFTGTGGSLSRLRVLRPGYAGDAIDVVHRPFLALARQADCLRTMELTGTNGSLQRVWGDRPRISDLSWQSRDLPWEHAVGTANLANRDLWINVPARADNDYIVKLLRLIQFGSDGVEPNAGPVADPVHPPLAAHLRCTIEHSNEVWNGTFPANAQCAADALRFADDPAWDAGGHHPALTATDGYGRALQWHVKRTVDIGVLIRQTLGEAAMGTRFHVTIGAQNVAHAALQQCHLPWIEQNWGAPISRFVHSIAVAPYWTAEESGFAKGLELRDNATVDEFFAQYQPSPERVLAPIPALVTHARHFGLDVIGYEGGTLFVLDDIRRIRPSAQEMLLQAYRDARFGDIVRGGFRRFHQLGGRRLQYYMLNPGAIGSFIATTDLDDLGGQILRGLHEGAHGSAGQLAPVVGFTHLVAGELLGADADGALAENTGILAPTLAAGHWAGPDLYYLLRSDRDLATTLRLRLQVGGDNGAGLREGRVTLDGAAIGSFSIPSDPGRVLADTPAPGFPLRLSPGLHTLRVTATGGTGTRLHSLIFGSPANTRPQFVGWLPAEAMGSALSRTDEIRVIDAETPDQIAVTASCDQLGDLVSSLTVATRPGDPAARLVTISLRSGAYGRATISLRATDPQGATRTVSYPIAVAPAGGSPCNWPTHENFLSVGPGATASAAADPQSSSSMMASDGRLATVWRAPASDPQWLVTTFARPVAIDRVRIRFGANRATSLVLRRSDHEPNWMFGALTFTDLAGGRVAGNVSDDITIPLHGQVAQHLWLVCESRARSDVGVEIAEFEVFGAVAVPSTSARRIDCGGSGGGGFAPDAGADGGYPAMRSLPVATDPLPLPPDQSVLRSDRYGACTYRFSGLGPGAWQTVNLYFAEAYFPGPGQRVFDVRANGADILKDFDIFQAAGGANRAVLRQARVAADAQGRIVLAFIPVVDNPQINAIEVLAESGGGAQPPIITAATATLAADGRTATVHVEGSDDGGAAELIASWSVLSAPADAAMPAITPNGAPSATQAEIAFSKAGRYLIQAALTDAGGRTATRNVELVVPVIRTALVQLWGEPNVDEGSTGNALFVQVLDQFGQIVLDDGGGPLQVPGVWTLEPGGLGGRITDDHVYAAPLRSSQGHEYATVRDGSLSCPARICVWPRRMPAITGLAVPDSAVVGVPFPIQVQVSHPDGLDGIAATWSVLEGPSGSPPPVIVGNGSPAALATTISLPRPGTWTLSVRVHDGCGRSVSRTATVLAGGPWIESPADAALTSLDSAQATILGGSATGEDRLLYTWTAAGPGTVAFACNGSNAAKEVVCAFQQPGIYRLTATITFAGGADPASTIALMVPPAPAQIASPPADLSVTSGQTALFTTTVSGLPVPTLQWQRRAPGATDWSDLAGATGTTYAFTAAFADHGSQFRAVATNAGGSAISAAATLSVSASAPAFTAHPQAVSLVAGTTASFTLAADGDPAPALQWQRLAPGASSWVDLAGATGATYAFTATFADQGSQFRAVASNPGGSVASDPALVTVTAGTTIPDPWSDGDVGAVDRPGGATYQGVSGSGEGMTLTSHGGDIWHAADACRLVGQPISGDVTIIARVAAPTASSDWAKAGVMLREDRTAGSRHAFMAITAGAGSAFQRRVVAGGPSIHTAGSRASTARWLRLVRTGATITASESVDGSTWMEVGSCSWDMGSVFIVGLAVSAQDPLATSTAIFDHVQIIRPSRG